MKPASPAQAECEPRPDRLPVGGSRGEVVCGGSIAGSSGRSYGLLAAGLTLAGVAFVYWRAWICDDAFITFRHVQNCMDGFGPVFNPGERVQAFTHPLWFLLLLGGGAVFDLYAFTVTLSLAMTCLFMLVLARALRAEPHRMLLLPAAAAFLLSSPSFVEFQSSGLENSLTNLLIVALWGGLLLMAGSVPQPFAVGSFRPVRPGLVALGCGLLLLNRPDHAVICTPLLAWAFGAAAARRSGRDLLAILGGLSPAIAWYAFATVYYGTPLPNTVYAKVAEPLPVALQNGLVYMWDYTAREPLHAAAILAILACGLALSLRDVIARRLHAWLRLSLVVAAIAQLVYVVFIGGDYMRGRFMVTPLVAACVLGVSMLARFGRRFDLFRFSVPVCVLVVPLTALVRFSPHLTVGPMTGFLSFRTQPVAARWLLAAVIVFWVLVVLLVLCSIRNRSARAGRTLPALTLSFGTLALFGCAGLWSFHLGMALWLAAGFLICGLTLLASSRWPQLTRELLQPLVLICAAGLAIVRPYSPDEHYPVNRGISDEYCWYAGDWDESRFIRPRRDRIGEWWNWASIAIKLRRYADVHGSVCIVRGALGMFSYEAGPKVHVLDGWGLSDAFISRCAPQRHSRTGHIDHDIPISYFHARGAVNLLPDWESRLERLDPTLREDALQMMRDADWEGSIAMEYLRDVQTVISGPLFSRERLRLLPKFVFPKRLSIEPELRRVPADLRTGLPAPIVPASAVGTNHA